MQLKISQSDVVLVVLDFLRRSNLVQSMRALEKETGLSADEWGNVISDGGGEEAGGAGGAPSSAGAADEERQQTLRARANDLSFLRGLILDGMFTDAERFLLPLADGNGGVGGGPFDYDRAVFLLRRQRFLEMIESGSAGGDSSSNGSKSQAVEALVSGLKELEGQCSKEEFHALCYCLTLDSVADSPAFSTWTPFGGRLDVFEAISADFVAAGGANGMGTVQDDDGAGGDERSRHVPPNHLLTLLHQAALHQLTALKAADEQTFRALSQAVHGESGARGLSGGSGEGRLRAMRSMRHSSCIASHRIASHCIASHRIASHRIASHRIASHRIASHRIASPGNSTTAGARGEMVGAHASVATLLFARAPGFVYKETRTNGDTVLAHARRCAVLLPTRAGQAPAPDLVTPRAWSASTSSAEGLAASTSPTLPARLAACLWPRLPRSVPWRETSAAAAALAPVAVRRRVCRLVYPWCATLLHLQRRQEQEVVVAAAAAAAAASARGGTSLATAAAAAAAATTTTWPSATRPPRAP